MYFIGKEKALRFAEENCTFNKDYYLEQIRKAEGRSYLYDRMDELKTAFEIEGFSEIVEVYCFSEYRDYDNQDKEVYYWSFTHIDPCVRLIGNGKIAYPYESSYRSKKYGLTLKREDMARGGSNDFLYKEQKPNFIGKASRKKIEDWFGYLKRENEARREYIDNANKKNREFQEKVKAKFPDAYMSIDKDGWMSECVIISGYVRFVFTSGEDGSIYRSTKVDILSVPSTKQLFGEE